MTDLICQCSLCRGDEYRADNPGTSYTSALTGFEPADRADVRLARCRNMMLLALHCRAAIPSLKSDIPLELADWTASIRSEL